MYFRTPTTSKFQGVIISNTILHSEDPGCDLKTSYYEWIILWFLIFFGGKS